jgi:hypothetical protein
MLVTHSCHFGKALPCTRKSRHVRSISLAFAYEFQTFNLSIVPDDRAAPGADCPDTDDNGEERLVPIALRSRALFARRQQGESVTRSDLASPNASMRSDCSNPASDSNALRAVS